MEDIQSLRSQGTRDRILESARILFSSAGYEGTTVRQIADRAQANVALVIRYYGSKENLFVTAVTFDLQLPDLEAIARDELGTRLVRHFLRVWEEEPIGRQLVALLKSSTTHLPASARLQEIFQAQLCAAVRAISHSSAEAEVRATLVASQMLGFALVRYVLQFPQRAMNQEKVVRQLGETIQRYLTDNF